MAIHSSATGANGKIFFSDTRAFGGLFPGVPTYKGKEFGLPDFWVSNFGLMEKEVDIILGKNENGLVSAFVKKYRNGNAWFSFG